MLRRVAAVLSPRSRAGRALGGAEPTEAEDVALVDASGLFDLTLYLVEGPDARAHPHGPLVHFCRHGWEEGRRPNLYFDPLWYAEQHGVRPGANPLAHYIRRGEAAGCRPVSYFDPAWYARTYRLRRGASPLAHYLAHRRSQLFAPNPHFDLSFYLARHGREIGPNRDPFAHLLRCGATRDLDPSADFDAAAYRRRAMAGSPPAARTPWAAADLRVPLVHYLDAELRRP